MTEDTENKYFIELAHRIIIDMETIKKDMLKSIVKGNKRAARRSRVNSVKIEKMFKGDRKLSLKYNKEDNA